VVNGDRVTIKDVTDFISAVGFPIAVAVILLWRFDANDRALIKALGTLTAAFDKLSHEITRNNRQ
jgi:YvrJ protein family